MNIFHPYFIIARNTNGFDIKKPKSSCRSLHANHRVLNGVIVVLQQFLNTHLPWRHILFARPKKNFLSD